MNSHCTYVESVQLDSNWFFVLCLVYCVESLAVFHVDKLKHAWLLAHATNTIAIDRESFNAIELSSSKRITVHRKNFGAA